MRNKLLVAGTLALAMTCTTVSGTVQLNTSILEASIKKAEALDSSKYTAETWKALQTALTEAK